MNASELERLPLRDIHLPDAVSWWPPAYGWYLLPVVLAALAWLAWRLTRGRPSKRHAGRLRALALQELDSVEARYRESGDARAALAATSVLLRRVALGVSPRAQVASLTGARWCEWLCQRSGAPDFRATAAALTELPYQPDPQQDVTQLLADCRTFLLSMRETAAGA